MLAILLWGFVIVMVIGWVVSILEEPSNAEYARRMKEDDRDPFYDLI